MDIGVVFWPNLMAILLGLTMAFLLLLLLLNNFFFVKKISSPPSSLSLPPGNMGLLPLVGETIAFLKPHKSNSMGTFLQEHISRYGKVFKSHLFGTPTIVSCDYEMNMFILQNEDKLFQVGYPKAMHGILGKLSLLIVTGDLHKKLRSFAISFNSTAASKTSSHSVFLNDVEKMTVLMMKSWIDSKEIVFCKEAKQFTFNVTVKHILSLTQGEPLATKILDDFLTYMKGFVSLPLYIPGTSYHKAVKARARISSTIEEIIKERRKETSTTRTKEDFLDMVLSRGSLSDEEIVSIILDMLLGGYETTATLMALIVYFLHHAPLAQQQLLEEHQAIRKNKKNGELLNWDDFKQMKFTYNVICEALRSGNVVKFVHRKAIQDVNYKGYLIPSGWQVLPIFAATHFDPSNHENPYEFNPWRWADQTMTKKVSPFGGGIRHCPGAELAKVEIAFFLHHLILNYRWKIKDEDFPLAHPYVEFKGGLQLEIEAREMHMGKK